VDTYQTLSAILNQYLRNIFRVFMFDISSVMTFTDDLKVRSSFMVDFTNDIMRDFTSGRIFNDPKRSF
jgi:hypothetical protein